MILSEAVEIFLGEYTNPRTQRAYKYIIQPMQNFLGPTRPVKSLKKVHLIEYSQHLQDKDWSPATFNKNIKGIRVFFNWLIKADVIQQSPAVILKRAKVPQKFDRAKAMPDEDLQILLARMKFHPRRLALILFLADTGCRIGGAAKLCVNDIDFDQLTALVVEKGNKARPVFFGETCADALTDWIQHWNKQPEDFVFSKNTKSIKATSLSQHFRRSCRMAGIKERGPHSLRYRKGFQLADSKVVPSTTQTILGHSNVTTTLQHYSPRDYETAAEQVREHAIQTGDKPDNVIHLPTGTEGS